VGPPETILEMDHPMTILSKFGSKLSHQDGCHGAVALLLKAALIQVSDYRLLGASGLIDAMKYLAFLLSKLISKKSFGYIIYASILNIQLI
jgi:hypothetical protein